MDGENREGRWITSKGRHIFIDSAGNFVLPCYFEKSLAKTKYNKHKKEFGNITLQEYVDKARRFSVSKNVDMFTLKSGRVYRYDKVENLLLITEKNRVITFFRPKNKERYWNEQKIEYEELTK